MEKEFIVASILHRTVEHMKRNEKQLPHGEWLLCLELLHRCDIRLKLIAIRPWLHFRCRRHPRFPRLETATRTNEQRKRERERTLSWKSHRANVNTFFFFFAVVVASHPRLFHFLSCADFDFLHWNDGREERNSQRRSRKKISGKWKYHDKNFIETKEHGVCSMHFKNLFIARARALASTHRALTRDAIKSTENMWSLWLWNRHDVQLSRRNTNREPMRRLDVEHMPWNAQCVSIEIHEIIIMINWWMEKWKKIKMN